MPIPLSKVPQIPTTRSVQLILSLVTVNFLGQSFFCFFVPRLTKHTHIQILSPWFLQKNKTKVLFSFIHARHANIQFSLSLSDSFLLSRAHS